MTISNKFGEYKVVGVEHDAHKWEDQKSSIADAVEWADFVTVENFSDGLTQNKETFSTDWQNLLFQTLLSKSGKEIYDVDIVTKDGVGLDDAFIAYYRSLPDSEIVTMSVSMPYAIYLGIKGKFTRRSFLKLGLAAFAGTLAGISLFKNYSYYISPELNNDLEKRLLDVVVDYRNAVAAAKTTLLAKNYTENDRKPKTAIIFGKGHEIGLQEYLSNLEYLKNRLLLYMPHPIARSFEEKLAFEYKLDKESLNWRVEKYQLDPMNITQLI